MSCTRSVVSPFTSSTHTWPRCAIGHGKTLPQLPSDHQRDKLLFVEIGGLFTGDAFSVAQDRHPVGQCHDLGQLVRYIDHADASRLEPGNERKELVDLARTQGRGWLVHDDYLGVARQRPRNLDQLLRGHAKMADLGLRIDLQPDLIQ